MGISDHGRVYQWTALFSAVFEEHVFVMEQDMETDAVGTVIQRFPRNPRAENAVTHPPSNAVAKRRVKDGWLFAHFFFSLFPSSIRFGNMREEKKPFHPLC